MNTTHTTTDCTTCKDGLVEVEFGNGNSPCTRMGFVTCSDCQGFGVRCSCGLAECEVEEIEIEVEEREAA